MPKQHNRIPETAHQERLYRFRGHMSPQEAEQQGVRNEVSATKEGDTAVIRLYDVIDSFGGFWGISANEIIAALDDVGKVATVQLRINSPGGDAFEGIAIYNALIAYAESTGATIDVIVDALAASAASIVAMAGDTITMATGSQLMIHDAWGLCMGNADDMAKMGNSLDHMSDNLATVYAERAGGSATDWRAAMKQETWYSAQEAVDAGLATKVAKKQTKKDDTTSKARFDLSVFNYAGRDEAPSPYDAMNSKLRASVRDITKSSQENHSMTAEQLESMGLPSDATDEQISARIADLIKNESDAPVVATPPVVEVPDGNGDGKPEVEDPEGKPAGTVPDEAPEAHLELPDTVAVVDKAQLADMQARLAAAEADIVRRRDTEAKAEREQVISNAIKDGKIAPAQRKYYEDLLTSAPTQAKALLGSLASNVVPMNEIGHGQDVDGTVDEDIYPTAYLTSSEKARIANLRGAI